LARRDRTPLTLTHACADDLIMRLALAVLTALVLSPLPAAAVYGPAFRTVVLKTEGPVQIVGAGGAGTTAGFGGFKVDRTCLSFRNTGARTVSHIHFRFVYYDATFKRVGDDVFDRKGTFGTGALNEGFNRRTLRTNDENCGFMHFPHEGIAINVIFVESVDYGDGSTWTAGAVDLPDSLKVPASSPQPFPSVTPPG
jgi:hypothetical protein